MSLAPSNLHKVPDRRTAMDLGPVLPRTAEVRGKDLYIGGVNMVNLAREMGTALYVMDEMDIRYRMRAYRDAFATAYPNSQVVYASKAFINKAMARIVDQEGLYLDVSGGGEFAIAMDTGFNPKHVVVHGNNKTPQELNEAIGAGAGRIIIDSRLELHRISGIAATYGKIQPIYMRITPGIEADTHAYIQTGMSDSKFGFTVDNDFAFKCVKDVLEEPNVRLAGLHCHIGSQIFNLDGFAKAVNKMVALIARIRDEYGVELKELDMGGGLGVAYLAEDEPCSIQEYAQTLAKALEEAKARYGISDLKLLVEPGRSIVANAGVSLYTVGIIKTLPNIRKYISVDGGMSDNVRTALYGATYEATIANKADDPRTEVVTIAGKHCESGDVINVDVPLQRADVGDIVCVFTTGAYCHSMASNYNGQPRAAVVFVRNGKATVTTRRETYADLMARDI